MKAHHLLVFAIAWLLSDRCLAQAPSDTYSTNRAAGCGIGVLPGPALAPPCPSGPTFGPGSTIYSQPMTQKPQTRVVQNGVITYVCPAPDSGSPLHDVNSNICDYCPLPKNGDRFYGTCQNLCLYETPQPCGSPGTPQPGTASGVAVAPVSGLTTALATAIDPLPYLPASELTKLFSEHIGPGTASPIAPEEIAGLYFLKSAPAIRDKLAAEYDKVNNQLGALNRKRRLTPAQTKARNDLAANRANLVTALHNLRVAYDETRKSWSWIGGGAFPETSTLNIPF